MAPDEGFGIQPALSVQIGQTQAKVGLKAIAPIATGDLLLSALVESCQDAIIVSDLTGTILTWNPSAERMFGYTQDEALGQSLKMLAVPGRAEETLRILEQFKRGEPVSDFQTVRLAKDGSIVEISLTVFPVRNPEGDVIAASGIVRDLSERRKAEQAAQKGQEPVAAVLESITDGFCALDADWRFTYVNAAAERINNMPRAELLGRTHWEVFPETVGTKIEREFRACVSEQSPREFENYFARFRRWFRVRCFPSPGGGLAVYFLDISDAKKADDERERFTRELAESERKWRFLANSLPQFVWIVEHKGQAEFINDYWFEYSGQPRDALDQERWSAAIHPEDHKIIAEMWERAIATRRETSFEYRIKRASDGEWRWHFGIHKPELAPDGAIRRWIGFGVDIHDRKVAETALRESEERFRSIVQAAAEGIWIIDPEGSTTFVNPRMAEMLGYSSEEMLGRSCFDFIHPDERESARAGFEKRKEGGDFTAREYRFICRDGSIRWISCVGSPMYDAQGRVRGVLATGMDTTERRATEDALRRVNAALEQFAYAAAHDLKEPLRNVTIYSQLLARSYSTKLDAKGEEYLNLSVESAQRMSALIDDLLAYTQVAAGAPTFAECDANEVLRGVLENLRTRIEAEEGNMAATDLPRIRMSPTDLTQVLQNLISNALKYRRNDPPIIRVSAERDGRDWIFSVEDNGEGIPPEHVEDIFKVFARLHGREVPGSGIGLSICERIVSNNGGRIWVESEVGKGSTFRFTVSAP